VDVHVSAPCSGKHGEKAEKSQRIVRQVWRGMTLECPRRTTEAVGEHDELEGQCERYV